LRNFSRLVAALFALSIAACSESSFFGEDEPPPLPGKREAVLEASRTVSADPSLAGTPMRLPEVAAPADWLQAGGNPAHTGGHLPWSTAPQLAWQTAKPVGRRDEARTLLSPPIVANDLVVLLDAVLNVRAFRTDDGSEIWAVGSALNGEHNGFGGGIASDGNYVYVAGGHRQAMALGLADGKLYWSADLPTPVRAPPTLSDGALFVQTTDDRLLALDATSGLSIWTLPGSVAVGPSLLGGAAPAVSGDVVVAAFRNGEVGLFRTPNGRELWRNSLASLSRLGFGARLSDITGLPVLGERAVYALSAAGRVAAFSLRTGRQVWERQAGGIQSLWVAGDYGFMVTREGDLICLQLADGGVPWVRPLRRFESLEERTGEYLYAGPVLAGGRLVLVRSDGMLVMHDPTTGEDRGEIAIGRRTLLPPVVAGGTLYTLSEDGTLSAFR